MSEQQVHGRFALVTTGVEGLDDVLGGGLSAHRLFLIEGNPGMGKTTLALQFLLEGLRQGERSLYDTLSETEDEVQAVAESHGWSLDDNRDSANSLARLLRMNGHEVRTAYDGHEALKEADDFSPELILLDIGLLELNGYEVARRIRQAPQHNGVKIIALTGWGQDEDRRPSREAGFDHHLVKPVDPDAPSTLLLTIKSD